MFLKVLHIFLLNNQFSIVNKIKLRYTRCRWIFINQDKDLKGFLRNDFGFKIIFLEKPNGVCNTKRLILITRRSKENV